MISSEFVPHRNPGPSQGGKLNGRCHIWNCIDISFFI
jgi:hypothetical protein